MITMANSNSMYAMFLLGTLWFLATSHVATSPTGNCTFENGMCNWVNRRGSDDFDWTIGSGPTSTSLTGPSSDRHGNPTAKYLYIETSSPRRMGEVARLESPVSYNQPFCFTFWYHMFGSSIERLGIFAQWASGYRHIQWMKSGNQGNTWRKADVDFNIDMIYGNYKIIIEGLRGSGNTGDIAVDDFVFKDGPCSSIHSVNSTPTPSIRYPAESTPAMPVGVAPSPTPLPTSGCGGVFNQPSAYFSSPGYPNNYPNNAHCTYNIEVPMDMQIVLTIHPYDLETNFDKLELRQMVSGSDNIVGILTGNENVERRFTSAENKFTLLFTSDGSVTRRGFRASYSVISSGPKTTIPPTPTCKPELHTSPSGDIKSPGYPNHYHNSANCVYNITVQDGKRIEIEFTTFDVEDDNGKCVYDQLMIFEGDSMVHPRIFCGRGPGKFISKGNKLFLRFVTDLSVTKQGFFGHYDTIEGAQGDVGTVDDASDKDAILNWMMQNKNKH